LKGKESGVDVVNWSSLLSYSDAVDIRIVLRSCGGADAWLSGFVIGVVAIAALTRFAEWEEWINLMLGLWVLVSPWALSFAAQTTAR